MKRVLGRFLTVGVVVLGSPVLVPAACAQNDQSIFIRQVMAPPQNRINGECIYQADPTQIQRSGGVLDVDVSTTYTAELLVGSQLEARGDQLNTRAEPNRTHINGAVVNVTSADGTTLGSFTTEGAGFVDPQTANTTSYGLVAVRLIDGATASKIAAELHAKADSLPPDPPDNKHPSKLVLANVKVFGKTLGGVDLETGEFQFPIDVCLGCLISFSQGDDPASPGVDCNLPLTTAGSQAAGTLPTPCVLGQDEFIDCRLCRAPDSNVKDPCKGQF